MCGFYCIAFIECMIARKTLLNYANVFSPNDYKKNDKIIYKYFKEKYGNPWLSIKKADETRNYLLEEIKDDDLMSKKHKQMSKILNYFEHFLIFCC